jgi:hypothetical protein
MIKHITLILSLLVFAALSACAVDKCPGEEVCGSGCMTTGASCCPDGEHFCASPYTCSASNTCTGGSSNDPSGTYYVSANGCTVGYSTVSYRGNDYAVCNGWYQVAVAAQCTKILDNCR